ncbi:MAG: VCBS repeat-containing protein [bacterium]|nr:VCBS repeat-containing protein [bacterium]
MRFLPALGFVLAPLASAQFAPRTLLTDERMSAIDDAVLADFDGDGDLDVVSAGTIGSGELFWHVGDGSGVFRSRIELATAVQASHLLVRDLDRDGELDVLYSDTSRRISWAANLGGALDAPLVLATANFGTPGVPRIAVADLDGDGLLDVAYAGSNHADEDIGWCRNLGQGQFAPAVTLPAPMRGLSQLVLADLDGDGNVDILTSGGVSNLQVQFGAVVWRRNLGGGAFAAPVVIENTPEPAHAGVVLDLGGDGDLDIVVGVAFETDLFWYENAGSGSFLARAILIPGARPLRTEVVDMDGDGALDLAWADLGGNRGVHWARRTGPSSFGPPTQPPTFGDAVRTLSAGDVDGDGDRDVVATWINPLDPYLGVLVQTGGVFEPREGIPDPAVNVARVLAVDVDTDGDTDVVTRTDTSIVSWHENQGGVLGPQQEINRGEDFTLLRGLVCVDVDGDGLRDIVTSDQILEDLIWYRGQAGGTFAAGAVLLTASRDIQSLAFADLDGDLDLDLVYGGPYDGDLVLRERLASLQFGPEVLLDGAASGLRRIELVDLDQDGDRDVATCALDWGSPTATRTAWYANQGGLSFGASQVLGTGAGGSDLFAADVDGDGTVDLVTASNFSGDVGWFRGQGGGAFAPRAIVVQDARGPITATAADFDGDGDTDFVYGVQTPGRLAWVEQLAGGTFGTPAELFDEVGRLRSVTAADFDGDGDADVVSASMFTHRVGVSENVFELGSESCPGVQNSTGFAAALAATGSAAVAANRCVLTATSVPTHRFGYFLTGTTPDVVMGPGGSQGNLCLGGAIGRYVGSLQSSGAEGELRTTLDLPNTPSPGGPVAIPPGETRYFQAWFRDVNPAPTSNFSSAVRVDFL